MLHSLIDQKYIRLRNKKPNFFAPDEAIDEMHLFCLRSWKDNSKRSIESWLCKQ